MKNVYILIFASVCALASFAQSANIDDGVIVNGVTWATRNVDMPGTFAAMPESAGMFYQWNRRIGWSTNDPLVNSNGGTTWDNTDPTGTKWETANDPSPDGWRVPTVEEIRTLFELDKVMNEWATIDGVNGCKFTDKSNGNAVFLPAASWRGYNGALSGANGNYYWSSTHDVSTNAYCMGFDSNFAYGDLSRYSRLGFLIRPVSTQSSAIENIKADKLQIHVNNGKLFIKGELQTNNVLIFDILGKQMVSGKLGSDNSIDIYSLSPGIYIVKIGNITVKFVKK